MVQLENIEAGRHGCEDVNNPINLVSAQDEFNH